MSRIGIGYSYFNNIREIPRGLKPILPFVYKAYCIDGKFKGYDSEDSFSTDGSTELLRSYPNTKICYCSAYQSDKRQQYLDMAMRDNCDFLIQLDTDEYLHPDYQDWNLFYKNLEYYSTKYPKERCFYMKQIQTKDWDRACNYLVRRGCFKRWVKIYKDPGSLKYCFGSHYRLMSKQFTEADVVNKKAEIYQAHYTIDGVRFMTDSKLRTADQLQKRLKFQKWNMQRENERTVEIIYKIKQSS